MAELTPERWQAIEALFQRVLTVDGAARAALLEEAGRDDPEIRREVETLLLHRGSAGGFLETPPRAPDLPDLTDDTAIGMVVGAYRLVERIGEGGMGRVYLGERADAEFEKRVAVKLIKRGMDTEDIVSRFRHERRVLARLEHPNIAQLLDGGATDDDRPYLVMEYVDGVPISDFCDRQGLSIAERLGLFRDVCDAVQYAHQNLVVHRDLKPSNIMVGTDGQVKLLDFGIAKVLRPDGGGPVTGVTAPGARAMTPWYASPEQVRGEPVSTASDIYALGVILYELLAGRRPYEFETGSTREMERVVCEVIPPRPSTRTGADEAGEGERIASRRHATPAALARHLRGDLDWITMRCLAKEPSERYATASELGADVQRYLQNEPVLAGPPSPAYRLRKFVRRHRVGVTVGGIVAAALVAAVGMTVWGLVTATIQRERAENQAELAQAVNGFLISMLEAPDPWLAQRITEVNREVRVVDILENAGREVDTAFADRPVAASAIHFVLGRTYGKLGSYAEAEAHLDRAWTLRREQLGPENPDTLDAKNELGNVYWRTERLDEAETLYVECLEARRRVLGETHERTLDSKTNLANVYWSRGDYARAEPLLAEVLREQRRQKGDDNRRTILSIGNLANQYVGLQRYAEAEKLYDEQIERCRRVFGDDHPDTATAINNLGRLYWEQGRLDEAEPLFRDLLTVQRRVLGDEHDGTLTVLNNLGAIYEGLDRHDEAERCYREALDIRLKHSGAEHASTMLSMSNLASLYRRMERYDDAIPLYARSVELHRKVRGPDFFGTGITVAGYGACLVKLERYDEAEPVLLDAHRILSASFGDEHARTRSVVEVLVELYEAWGRPEDAARYRVRLEDAGDGA